MSEFKRGDKVTVTHDDTVLTATYEFKGLGYHAVRLTDDETTPVNNFPVTHWKVERVKPMLEDYMRDAEPGTIIELTPGVEATRWLRTQDTGNHADHAWVSLRTGMFQGQQPPNSWGRIYQDYNVIKEGKGE
jgi:hypothetical protein